MPPLVNSPDVVYDHTYQKLLERNQAYYAKYPQDVQAVQQIVAFLDRNAVALPNGGRLTRERFLDLGLAFGGHGGIDSVHRPSLPHSHTLPYTHSLITHAFSHSLSR